MIMESKKVKSASCFFFNLLLILSVTAVYSVQTEEKVFEGTQKNTPDIYRILVTKAKSIENARAIAQRLNKITNSPVYINSIDVMS